MGDIVVVRMMGEGNWAVYNTYTNRILCLMAPTQEEKERWLDAAEQRPFDPTPLEEGYFELSGYYRCEKDEAEVLARWKFNSGYFP